MNNPKVSETASNGMWFPQRCESAAGIYHFKRIQVTYRGSIRILLLLLLSFHSARRDLNHSSIKPHTNAILCKPGQDMKVQCMVGKPSPQTHSFKYAWVCPGNLTP